MGISFLALSRQYHLYYKITLKAHCNFPGSSILQTKAVIFLVLMEHHRNMRFTHPQAWGVGGTVPRA
jgi:hypothetical protein